MHLYLYGSCFLQYRCIAVDVPISCDEEGYQLTCIVNKYWPEISILHDNGYVLVHVAFPFQIQIRKGNHFLWDIQ